MATRVEIMWSHRFRNDMTRLRQFADAKPIGAHAYLLRGLEKLSFDLGEPAYCYAPSFALTGDLRGCRRVRFQQRGRLFYIANQQTDRAAILWFGDNRKDGDANDPYKIIARLLRSTEFDRCFENIGVTKPKIS